MGRPGNAGRLFFVDTRCIENGQGGEVDKIQMIVFEWIRKLSLFLKE